MLGWLLALVLVIPHWVDKRQLGALALTAGLPEAVVLAMAWQESGSNLNPALRGHHCWNETVGHLADCEVGRFQIKPSTGKARCPEFNVFTYRGNLDCFAKAFGEDYRVYGFSGAIERWNAGGGHAPEYLEDVLAAVGWITLKEEGLRDE